MYRVPLVGGSVAVRLGAKLSLYMGRNRTVFVKE